MSRPDLRLVLSPQAEEDFTDILQYTLQVWGEIQMMAYRAVLNDGLEFIRTNPKAGSMKEQISQQHRFFVVGEHLIAYRERDNAIEISRILHGRMDIKNQLG